MHRWFRQIFILTLLMLAAFTSRAGAQAAAAASSAIAQSAPSTASAAAAALDSAQRDVQLRKLIGDLGLPGASPTDAAAPSTDIPFTLPASVSSDPTAIALPDITETVPTTTSPKKLSASIEILLLLSVLTLAPSILLMTTCFTRIVIVMSLLRQALGAAQLPPNQILIGLSLFMTFLVMTPTWSKVNADAIAPYNAGKITQAQAFTNAISDMRDFMIRQIEAAHNEDDVYLFHAYAHPNSGNPQTWAQVDTTTLVPAFVLSELKVSFLMGFRIYLPFLIIDMVISSVLISIGMQLLPPVMVSLPFKLLLFVLVDGWHLVCATLLASFATG
ncbi:MAG TPA: flagellar type III secretion system pore protein FliP [Phycisphaerae bacterium]|jgi:flagellar biosynthetic protein FliP|nr:flagellar type III secretion system pore protein FliP [Phycisphaerae bacterium]